MTLGEELRRRRESHGIELGEIAEATCIGVRFLRAIEENDFKTLPGGLFTRSFIRSFARYVGFDEGMALRLYFDQTGEGETEEYEFAGDATRAGAQSAFWANVIIAVAVLAILGLGGLAGWHYWNRTQQMGRFPAQGPAVSPGTVPRVDAADSTQKSEPINPPSVQASPGTDSTPSQPQTEAGSPLVAPGAATEAPLLQAPPEVVTSTSTPAIDEGSQPEVVTIPPPAQLALSIRANGSSYVYVQADSTMPRGETLQSGDRRVFTATEKLVISVQDPSQLIINVNGYPIRLPRGGAAGDTVVITPRNLSRFISQ